MADTVPSQEQGVTRQSLMAYFPDGGYQSRLQPFPEYGCIYVKNAKAGTSTVLLWLHRILSGDHGFTPSGVSIHFENKLPTPSEVGDDKTVEMLSGAAFRFSFVRDPIRRAESAYVNKVVLAMDGRLGRRKKLQRVLGLVEDREVVPTVDQFVAALEAQEPIEMDAHWRPQHLNLMHPLITYDLVGRLETFAADLARIREATGMPDVPFEAQNVSARKSDGPFEGRPDLVRRVEQVYARDFELYGC